MSDEQNIALLAQFYDYAVSQGTAESCAATVSFLSEGCQIEEGTTRRLAPAAISLALTGGPILQRHRTWIMIGKGYASLPRNQQTKVTEPYRRYAEVYQKGLESARATRAGSRQLSAPHAQAPLFLEHQESAHDSPDRSSASHVSSPPPRPNPIPVQHSRSQQRSGGQQPNPPVSRPGMPSALPSNVASLYAAAHHLPTTRQATSPRSSLTGAVGPENTLQLHDPTGEVERARDQLDNQPTLTVGLVYSPRGNAPGR
ncbi:hypothetical protein J2X68_008064 [Streptomyces sp. 3330]|nr:hypothetical protein [Streptomyces sp. 3330]